MNRRWQHELPAEVCNVLYLTYIANSHWHEMALDTKLQLSQDQLKIQHVEGTSSSNEP